MALIPPKPPAFPPKNGSEGAAFPVDHEYPVNWVVLGTWTHLVRTQAGFNKACSYIRDCGYHDEMTDLRLSNKPVYPAVVNFNPCYAGSWYMQVSWSKLDAYVDMLTSTLEAIAKNDPRTAERLSTMFSKKD